MIFTGTFQNKIDAKGRVSVPAPFRTLIQASPSRQMALFPSLRFEGALEGMTGDLLNAIAQQTGVAKGNLVTKARPNPYSLIFRSSHSLHIDDAGRISLPDTLVTKAGLERTAVFTGEGHSFILWSPAAYEAQMAADMAALAENPNAEEFEIDFAAAAASMAGAA